MNAVEKFQTNDRMPPIDNLLFKNRWKHFGVIDWKRE